MIPDDQQILMGWPDIAKACGVSVPVIKNIAKRYSMPYARMCGKVTLPKIMLVAWVAGLCDIVGKGDGEDEYVLQRLRNLKRIPQKEKEVPKNDDSRKSIPKENSSDSSDRGGRGD